MPETQFIIWLEEDVKILVFRNTHRGRYTSFAVVLTHQTEAGWLDVGRFDTAHGVPHRDVLGKKAGLLQKIWYDDVEVDFLVETDWGYAAVEVKASSTWRNQYGLGLRKLRDELAPREVRTFGVFRGPQAAKFGEIEVLPVVEFLSRLWSGRVI